MDNKSVIRSFFSRFFDTKNLVNGEDIFAAGYVNSLFAMQLIAWLEKEFSLVILDEDLQIKNFNSVDAISSFVVHKRALEACN